GSFGFTAGTACSSINMSSGSISNLSTWGKNITDAFYLSGGSFTNNGAVGPCAFNLAGGTFTNRGTLSLINTSTFSGGTYQGTPTGILNLAGILNSSIPINDNINV